MMFFKTTRLVAIRFLGLWGVNDEIGKQHESKQGWTLNQQHGERETCGSYSPNRSDTDLAICKSKERILGLLLERGIPGLTVCVSKKGKISWEAGFGFCDVENQLICDPDAHMRIASISKSLFSATVVAPMVEHGKIDLDSSIYNYVTVEEFPRQKFQGRERDISLKQLLSHTSGIRHYKRSEPEDAKLRPIGSKSSKKIYQDDAQYNREEFFSRNTYRDVIDALEPIRQNAINEEPGKFRYTTYGYTLLSAVVQKIHQIDEKSQSEQIEDFWIKVLHKDWGLNDTHLDQDEMLISKRARYYMRTGYRGELINAPYQDSSVKWAGGGLISTTKDLVKFGNALIDCYHARDNAKLKRATLDLFWKEIENSYALGFKVRQATENVDLAIYHSGNALGSSSVLVICPKSEVVVAILANLDSINLEYLGMFIADQFSNV